MTPPSFMFIVPDPDQRRRGFQRGLTLLEVVVGLAILGLMSGAIYAIVAGSIESTMMLQKLQTEDRRVENFLAQTRRALSRLPDGATAQLKLIESEPLRQELILRGVPEAYVWGDFSRWEKQVVTLSPQPWPEERAARISRFDPRGKDGPPPAQRYALAMTVPDFFRTDEDGEPAPASPLQTDRGHPLLKADQQGRFWFDLLPEIERVEWRFYDPAKKLWIEQAPPGRPPLIELLLTLPGRKEPLRAVFETA